MEWWKVDGKSALTNFAVQNKLHLVYEDEGVGLELTRDDGEEQPAFTQIKAILTLSTGEQLSHGGTGTTRKDAEKFASLGLVRAACS